MDYQAINAGNTDDEDKDEPEPAVGFRYMHTPYSDVIEQEEFASEYRRKIVLLYFASLPLSILVSAAVARYAFAQMLVSKILLFCAVGILCVGVPYFTFFGFFTVADFLKLPVWFYSWPLLPVVIGGVAVAKGSKKDAAFGNVLVVVGILVMVANESARLVSWWTEEERLRLWPPLPGTDPLDHLF